MMDQIVEDTDMYYKFDVVLVGAGGAGLMAAMQLPNASVAVLSKVYPTPPCAAPVWERVG